MSTSFKAQLQAIEDGNCRTSRIKIADDVNQMLETFQQAHKENTGNHISKQDIVYKLIAYGSPGLMQEAATHKEQAAQRAAM